MAPRVLIFGTGAIGAGYAYVLLRKLPTRNVVAIWPHLSTDNRARRLGSDSVEPSKNYDYIIITTKILPSSPSIAELIRPAVSETTAIVLIQNGIAIEQEYAQMYPSSPLLSVVVYFAVTQTAPAVIDHSEIEQLHVGTFPTEALPEHKRVARDFVCLITECGATAKLHDDIQPQRWSKLILNASLNPICALSRSRDTQFIQTGEDSLQFMRDTMIEIVSVAQALDYSDVNEDLINTSIGRIKTRRQPGVQPSMMADALAGRNMEVEAIVGNVVKLAKEHNVRVPILRTLHNLTQALDASFTRERQISATLAA